MNKDLNFMVKALIGMDIAEFVQSQVELGEQATQERVFDFLAQAKNALPENPDLIH